MNRLSRRRVLVLGSTTLATLAAGCSGDGGDGGGDGTDDGNGNGNGGTETVDMTDDLVFDPDSLTISAGTTVTWENVGVVDHTVTAYEDKIPADAEYFASGGFESEGSARDNQQAGFVGEGETYSHTFEVPGSYEYFCIPHESAGMTASITVE